MRTTLTLDPTVVSAARAMARAEHISLGAAVSRLALAGLRPPPRGASETSGFPVLSGDPDHPITDELVAAYQDDDSDDVNDAS